MYNPNRNQDLLSVVLDKFQTEIGTNINDSCHHRHDEQRWHFDDIEDEL